MSPVVNRVIVAVTLKPGVVTLLPPASVNCTTGDCGNAMVFVATSDGSLVIFNPCESPGFTSTVDVVLKPPDVNVSVVRPSSVSVRFLKRTYPSFAVATVVVPLSPSVDDETTTSLPEIARTLPLESWRCNL